MEKSLKRKLSSTSASSGIGAESSSGDESNNILQLNSVTPKFEIADLNDLPCDPSERKRISDYHPNQRDEIRRKYLIRGPCQPRGHSFPIRMIGKKGRRFSPLWFYQFGNWLEYSLKADKAFCLCCYLFRDDFGKKYGNGAFVSEGFHSWNKTEKLKLHVGDVNSFHNRAVKKCEDLMKQDQSIVVSLQNQSDIVRNNQMVASSNQKDIANCFAQEVLKPILEEIGDDVFGLFLDESIDVSKKKQMVVVLRYVDTCGVLKERFVGLVRVMETSALSLKSAIESLLLDYGLSLKKIRSQSYDGASNMRDEFNGLKALIMEENSSAYYVHCFSHQLQSIVVTVAKKHFGVGNFFDMIDLLMNVVSTSCKQKDIIREEHKKKVHEAVGNTETEKRSYYETILNLLVLFQDVVEVLKYVEEEGDNNLSQRQANNLQIYFNSFDFVFYLQLMLQILGVTHTLSHALQIKVDISNVIPLMKSTKKLLQKFRDDEFDSLLNKIYSFCEQHDFETLNMEEDYVNKKNRKQKTNITFRNYYEVNCFNTVVDRQIQEFDDRCNEVSLELFTCMTALSPNHSFREFDRSKLVKFAEMYPDDFSYAERVILEHQLEIYVDDMKQDERFANLNSIADLARLMVETKKHVSHPLVYRLLKLALILPVETATVERSFSEIKLVKSDLCNRIGEDCLNACLICNVEKEALANVTNEDVINCLEKMKTPNRCGM